MNPQEFLNNFGAVANAPGGVKKLREMILQLAMMGKLVEQDLKDEPASELLKKIEEEKKRLVKDGIIRRPEILSKIKPEEFPYDVPTGWLWLRLGDVGETNIGLTYKPSDICEQGIPVLRSSNVQKGKLDFADLVRVKTEVKKSVLVKEGDLLICARNGSRALVGKTALITGLSEEMAFGAFMAIFRSRINFYLLYFINSPLFRKMIAEVNTMTINQITQNNLKTTIFPLPPLAEQHRIVAKVDQLMSLCDKLEAQQEKRSELIGNTRKNALDALSDATGGEELRTAWKRVEENMGVLFENPEDVEDLKKCVLQNAVMGKLVEQNPKDEPASVLLKKIEKEKAELVKKGEIKKEKLLPAIREDEKPFEIPKGWEWCRLGDIALQSDSGWSPQCLPTPRIGNDWGILKVSSVSWGIFKPFENKALPSHFTPKLDCEVKNGDFLLSRANTEDLVARSVIVEDNSTHLMMSDKLVRFKISTQINSHFINTANGSQHSRLYYVKHASGTSSSMKNIGRDIMTKLPISLPPLAEQNRIVAKTQSLLALCDTLQSQLSKSRKIAENLAQSVVESITGITTEKQAKMKIPKTELVSKLVLAKKPSTKDNAPLSILLANHNNELSAKALWNNSGLPIDQFYRQLKTEMVAGWIVEPKKAEVVIVEE